MTTQTLAPTDTSNSQQQLFQKLALLRHVFAKAGDESNARKMTELARKVNDSEFVIGFCGHFSAGKSTMINRIAGVDLLPSNPIPTSANLAKIYSGDTAFARVYFEDGEAVEFPSPYDLDEIRRHAIDGHVRSIEIRHPLTSFEPGITLLDTPGIDSTDDSHRMATESALHLADIIFYVTDYNHVLSEMNLAFLKQMNDQHKRIALVVNQIDKHVSTELDFDDYRKAIANAFSAQNIELEHIFYTSLKSADHPENQFSDLTAYIDRFIENKDVLLFENAEASAKQLIKDHIEWQIDQQNDERERLEQSLEALSENGRQNLRKEYHELERQLKELKEKPDQFFETSQTELNKTLDSAILMPYETREAGRDYIESMQPDFKIGLFASKKKTEQDRQKRLDHFYKKVTETASALDWQVKELLVKKTEDFGIQDESFKESIYDLEVTHDQNMLTEQIQSGATLNAQYVLRYTEQVAEAIKQRYRKFALEKLEEGQAILARDVMTTTEQLQSSLAEMNEKVTAQNQLQQLDAKVENERQRLYAILEGQIDEEEFEVAIAHFPKQDQQPGIKRTLHEPKQPVESNKQPSVEKIRLAEGPKKTESADFKQRLMVTAEQLKQTAEQITSIKGLQTLAQDMQERARRLENNRFTIALFGAFSAGKSSFANALIGKKVLPVSPNPTTAAINKILPADNEHPHETATVQFKQEHEILADVRKALKPYRATLSNLNELPRLLKKIDSAQTPFLQAVTNGLTEVEDLFGTKQPVDIQTFYDIVANEAKAVFVESIELYIDCPLTQQGITLVDTPGADSINARHTGVAFNYIKNADAILFVTYYNHAFSQADREFLIQLGRVKDSFAMDKMFFIVNAADLAASENELDTVVDYVHDNLVSYGIRHPRIYPISSQRALAEKLEEYSAHGVNPSDSGMSRFEHEFRQFTMEELTNIAVKAAHDDIDHAIQMLDSYIASAQEDETVRQEKGEAALQTKAEIETFIENLSTVAEKRALDQEIEQLIYYVNQRVFLRYVDLFKETFSSANIGTAGQNKKKVLHDCLDELLQMIGFDLAQEMRATTLRIETFINRLLDERFAKIKEDVRRTAGDTIFTIYEKPPFVTPEFENGLQELDPSNFNDVLGFFKNTKQFFEKGGKAVMQDRLQERLKEPVTHYLNDARERIKSIYDQAFDEKVETLKTRLLEQLKEYTEGKIAALSMDIDVDELIRTKKSIEKVRSNR